MPNRLGFAKDCITCTSSTQPAIVGASSSGGPSPSASAAPPPAAALPAPAPGGGGARSPDAMWPCHAERLACSGMRTRAGRSFHKDGYSRCSEKRRFFPIRSDSGWPVKPMSCCTASTYWSTCALPPGRYLSAEALYRLMICVAASLRALEWEWRSGASVQSAWCGYSASSMPSALCTTARHVWSSCAIRLASCGSTTRQ
mmetsp:Transcript_3152/g.8309  ORF Transcript_3152/g.8309 Transcript_3152/m.8309 type:complete len:200 (+) Transcript_3152:977-1576(+)